VGAGPDLLLVVLGLDLEGELVAVDASELGAHLDGLALGRRREVLDVDLEAHGRVPWRQVSLNGLDAGALHQPDHGGGGENAVAAYVLHDEAVIDDADDLCGHPRLQVLARHRVLPTVPGRRGST